MYLNYVHVKLKPLTMLQIIQMILLTLNTKFVNVDHYNYRNEEIKEQALDIEKIVIFMK